MTLLDIDGKVSNQYGVTSTPIKMIIGRDGLLRGAAIGYRQWDKPQVMEIIKELMNDSQDG